MLGNFKLVVHEKHCSCYTPTFTQGLTVFSIFKRQKKEVEPQKNADLEELDVETTEETTPLKKSFFQRLKQGLAKTRSQLSKNLANLFLGRKQIDEELLEDIETALLTADLGVEATSYLIEKLTERMSRSALKDPQMLYTALKEDCLSILKPSEAPLILSTEHQPFVILMIGVNGAGKTTTIGKLAKQFQRQGKTVLLAAGDTFRAAAIEQLQVWGDRNKIPVISQHHGADSASVIYDATMAAKARHIDVVIADTAGRLHNKQNLMNELNKIVRVLKKTDVKAPHEIMLVLDANCGQNGLAQAESFHTVAPISGITLTKMDGTAKGGIIFAIAQKLKLPIRYIGVGETIDDLRPFEAQSFVDALFDPDDVQN